MTIATDLGCISQDVARYIKAANLIVIESNYDEQMLVTRKISLLPEDKNKIGSWPSEQSSDS